MGSDDLKRFRVVKGGGKKQPWAKNDSSESEQITCRMCEPVMGVQPSMYIEVHLGPRELKGEIVHSTRSLICAYCFMRGRITQAT